MKKFCGTVFLWISYFFWISLCVRVDMVYGAAMNSPFFPMMSWIAASIFRLSSLVVTWVSSIPIAVTMSKSFSGRK